jgi:hypothetical protein
MVMNIRKKGFLFASVCCAALLAACGDQRGKPNAFRVDNIWWKRGEM